MVFYFLALFGLGCGLVVCSMFGRIEFGLRSGTWDCEYAGRIEFGSENTSAILGCCGVTQIERIFNNVIRRCNRCTDKNIVFLFSYPAFICGASYSRKFVFIRG